MENPFSPYPLPAPFPDLTWRQWLMIGWLMALLGGWLIGLGYGTWMLIESPTLSLADSDFWGPVSVVAGVVFFATLAANTAAVFAILAVRFVRKLAKR